MSPKWAFGIAMLPVGALCFYQAHVGRTVLPKWPIWAHLFCSAFYKDAAFLLTVESFLLTAELFCLQLCLGVFLLTI